MIAYNGTTCHHIEVPKLVQTEDIFCGAQCSESRDTAVSLTLLFQRPHSLGTGLCRWAILAADITPVSLDAVRLNRR